MDIGIFNKVFKGLVPENFNPLEHGLHIYKESDIPADYYDVSKLLCKIDQLIYNPKKNAYLQLLQWKKIGKAASELLVFQQEMIKNWAEESEQWKAGKARNNRKRWSAGEDELLIEYVSKNVSIHEISKIFGRTPAAISTRVSELVGINKLSQEIAGKFIGKLNGMDIEAHIDGTLIKNKKEGK